MALPAGEKSKSPFRQVVYEIHASVPVDDHNHDFHRYVATLIIKLFQSRLTNMKVHRVDAQCKNFFLWPSKPSPALRHAEAEQAQVKAEAQK